MFAGLPKPFDVTRYHSLAIARDDVPAELEVTATSDDGEIMGVRHRSLAVEGVQFHPEAILTEHGMRCSATSSRRAAESRASSCAARSVTRNLRTPPP